MFTKKIEVTEEKDTLALARAIQQEMEAELWQLKNIAQALEIRAEIEGSYSLDDYIEDTEIYRSYRVRKIEVETINREIKKIKLLKQDLAKEDAHFMNLYNSYFRDAKLKLQERFKYNSRTDQYNRGDCKKMMEHLFDANRFLKNTASPERSEETIKNLMISSNNKEIKAVANEFRQKFNALLEASHIFYSVILDNLQKSPVNQAEHDNIVKEMEAGKKSLSEIVPQSELLKKLTKLANDCIEGVKSMPPFEEISPKSSQSL